MTVWQVLTHFWAHHDLFYATHFPTFRSFADWNHDQFGLPGWSFRALRAWVNVHG